MAGPRASGCEASSSHVRELSSSFLLSPASPPSLLTPRDLDLDLDAAHAPPMKDPYPELQGGGSLMLAWQIRNKKILIVGGGEVGARPPAWVQSEHRL